MISDKRDDRVFGGVFLIGLAVLFLTSYWWPGILFVVGAAMLARTMANGQDWTSDRGGIGIIVVGLVFAALDVFGKFFDHGAVFPLVLIALGLFLLFGRNGRWQQGAWGRRQDDDLKSKRDDVV